MFTGIVQGCYSIDAIDRLPGLHRLTIGMPSQMLEGVALGASISIDGVCLTVSEFDDTTVKFDVMDQTLQVTTLADLDIGSQVNVERSAKQGDEIGGHIVSGHVDDVATIVSIEEPENNRFVEYQVQPERMKYIFDKGFIGLNGCSLTVAKVDRDNNRFTVCYIPETLKMTNHGIKAIGDKVNLEIDRQTQTIVETVEAYLKNQHTS